jgi:hypothetical protein
MVVVVVVVVVVLLLLLLLTLQVARAISWRSLQSTSWSGLATTP